MSIILDQDIYKWLIGLDMLKMSAVARQLPEGKVELDPSVTSYFSTGLLFSRLITKIVKNIAKTTNISHVNLSSLDGMKFAPSAASLTHNWNIIADVLRQLNIQIDHDVKHLIVNGDHDMLIEVLKDMHSHFRPKNVPYSSQGGNRRSSSRDRSSSVESPVKGSGKGSPSPYKARRFETDAIDIEKVKVNKDLKSTNTVLEFFLVSLSKHLSLTPKQAVTLLTNGFKYLAHVQAKGVKGVFEPVSYWYQDVYAHTDHLITLIEKDKENNVNLVQQACRPGLLSKSSEVVEWTCRLFSKMALEFTNRNLMPMAWEWFVSDHGGMQGCLMGLKRHPSLAESVISVLVQYSRYDMIDLFTIHLKNICPDVKDQVHMMLLLYKPLSESNFTRDEIVNSGVLDSWIATVVKFLENDSGIDTETRLSCLSLMCDVWLSHPEKIEEQDEVSAAILNSLKKTARDKSKPVALNTISLLFKLLDQFTTGKNSYATVIYKTLTFSVVENYASATMREFILRNFKVLFESNTTIPIGVLLEPLLKHMQTDDLTSSTINVFDIEFFTLVIKHSKFNESHALPLFYVLADVYLNNLAFSKESHKLIIEILSAHLKSEPLQEAVHKFVKASLAMFYSSEKNKRPKQKVAAPYFNQMPVTKPIPVAELESETLKAQKRAMIIQILRSIIGLQNSAVNQRAKTFILYTHVQLKTQLKTEHKGILSLISLFGDPSSVIPQFEKDMKSSKFIEGGIDFNNENVNFAKANDPSKNAESDAINFLKGAGSGQKKKNLNTSELSTKKLPKPDPKVEEELGMIQREVQQKRMKRIEEENIEKEKMEKQKKKLKDQLDKRKIELGVASKNQKNAEENIIFDEGSRDLEKLLEKKHGLPEIELVNLDDEEERDKEAVDIFLKKYHKILHHLFMTYANIGFSTQDSSSFSKIADKNSVINLPDIYKMLNDHDCTKYSTKEEVNTLVRLINTQFQDRHDLKTLTFQGFKDFFVQFAIFAFSRPPKDLSHMPIFVSVEALLQIFRNATLAKGKSVLLYDDPSSTEVGDKDLHAFLNEALLKDPEYPLPEAYKRIVEKSAKFTYQLPESLDISEAYRDCYEILEDLINAAFRIRLTEPIVTFDTIPKAKLKVYDPTKIEYSSDHHLKPIGSTKKLIKAESNEGLKRRVLNAENRPKLSLELKKEVASFPYKDRAFAQEVAEVLEGVLQLVEEGKTSLEKDKISLKARQKEAKDREKEELRKQEEANEQKRRQRAEEIKTLLKDHKSTKEDPKKSKPEEMSSPSKKKEEERLRYVAEQKEKAKGFKEKKEEEKKTKEEEEERKKKQEEEDKKKNFKEFNKQKVENMSKKFDEIKSKRDEEEVKKKAKEEEEKKKKLNREKNMKDIIEKEKEKREKQREITARIKQLVRDSGMKKTFEKYEKELQTVYRYYIDSVHLSIGTGHPLETLPFQGYAAFALDFNIFPGIISLSETKALYNSITLDKKVEQGVPLGITYEEFLESLMRIAIKSKEKLNRIYSIKSRLREAKDKETYNKAEEDMRRERAEDENNDNEYEYNNNQDDQYEEIEGTTKNTLEGLLIYLDLPQDRATLAKKLKLFNEERPKNWKEKKNYWKKDLVEGKLNDAFSKIPGDLDRESIMNDD